MLRTRLLPAFLLLTFLATFALPAWAAGEKPKDFIGTWAFDTPAEMKAQIAEAEKALKANPDDEMSKAMLEMMKVLTTMEMVFSDKGVEMKVGGETKEESADWWATKNADGTWVITVKDKDGKEDPATAKIEGDTLTIISKEGEPPMTFTRKK